MVFCLTIQLQLAIVTVYGGWDFYFYELTYSRKICISGVLRGNDWIAVSTVTVLYYSYSISNSIKTEDRKLFANFYNGRPQ